MTDFGLPQSSTPIFHHSVRLGSPSNVADNSTSSQSWIRLESRFLSSSLLCLAQLLQFWASYSQVLVKFCAG